MSSGPLHPYSVLSRSEGVRDPKIRSGTQSALLSSLLSGSKCAASSGSWAALGILKRWKFILAQGLPRGEWEDSLGGAVGKLAPVSAPCPAPLSIAALRRSAWILLVEAANSGSVGLWEAYLLLLLSSEGLVAGLEWERLEIRKAV